MLCNSSTNTSCSSVLVSTVMLFSSIFFFGINFMSFYLIVTAPTATPDWCDISICFNPHFCFSLKNQLYQDFQERIFYPSFPNVASLFLLFVCQEIICEFPCFLLLLP